MGATTGPGRERQSPGGLVDILVRPAQALDDPLAGEAQPDLMAKVGQLRQPIEKRQVLVPGGAEADAGVDGDTVGGKSQILEASDAAGQPAGNGADGMRVVRGQDMAHAVNQHVAALPMGQKRPHAPG